MLLATNAIWFCVVALRVKQIGNSLRPLMKRGLAKFLPIGMFQSSFLDKLQIALFKILGYLDFIL